MIAVESNIPIPPRGHYRPPRGVPLKHKYPWMTMAVGDSFIFPNRSCILHTERLASSSVSYRHYMAHPRYVVRKVTENGAEVVRVWRIA